MKGGREASADEYPCGKKHSDEMKSLSADE